MSRDAWMACIYVSMYLCLYVSMYLCIYVCMYLCIYVCMYLYMHVCSNVDIRGHVVPSTNLTNPFQP